MSTGLRLNHVEFAHRPGEETLAVLLLEALGCRCRGIDTPPYGRYVVVDLDGSPHGQNDMFVSEAEPEQLALEQTFGEMMAAPGPAAFRGLQRERPFRASHVGIRLPSVAALRTAVARLENLASGELARRLELGVPMSRSVAEARATSSPVEQLWIWTDVFSTGLLTFGQMIELQAYDLT